MQVAVTRAVHQVAEFQAILEQYGFSVLALPLIDIEPVSDLSNLDQALSHLESFTMVVVTSGNASDLVLSRMRELSITKWPKLTRLLCVGDESGQKFVQAGFSVELAPSQPSSAQGLCTYLQSRHELGCQRVLFPRASRGRRALIDAMLAAGSQVTEVDVYHTTVYWPIQQTLQSAMDVSHVDWITFTSASAVEALVSLVGPTRAYQWLHQDGVRVACMGKTTAEALEAVGVIKPLLPKQASLRALAMAMADY